MGGSPRAFDAWSVWTTLDSIVGSINLKESIIHRLPAVNPHDTFQQANWVVQDLGLGVGCLKGAMHFVGINSMFSSSAPTPLGIS